jgi:glycosyltransferase involved in cell wall biosynthesis
MRKYIGDTLGIKKAYAIPNASDPALFEKQNLKETALSHLKNKFIVCWTGSADTPWQAVELIIETAKRIQDIDRDILFIMITGDSIFRLPVLKNLLVLKQVPFGDIPHYLAAADVCLCLYKKYEWIEYGFYGSSLKLFDYMAAGKAVIASDMGQISTIIKDEVNGLLVDNEIETIVNKILELKANQEKRRTLGRNARQDIISIYNWDRVAEKTEAVLMEVCNK